MLPLLKLSVMGMSKPFHKPSVKKPPHVKKFSTQRYSSLCRDSKFPPIWMLVHCGAETSLGPQLGTSRLSGRPAFGRTPSEPRGPSLRPLGSFCPSVNSIHSWVFSITALGAVVLSKELFLINFVASSLPIISLTDPWAQMVTEGNGTCSMGCPVVQTVVRTGLLFQFWYAPLERNTAKETANPTTITQRSLKNIIRR